VIVSGDLNHARQIASDAGAFFNPEIDICISRDEGGVLVGGMIYTGYTGASIGCHFAGYRPDWINRDLLWVGFDYPFMQLGCAVLFCQVPETNKKALEINAKLGFKIVAKIDDVFPDGACLVHALRREDCRWLKMTPRHIGTGGVNHGRQSKGSTTT